MLSQFSVKNYKSIRDEITLDLAAVSIAEHKESLIITPSKESYLPLAVLYGPNGGGKSNVLEALTALLLKIIKPMDMVKSVSDIRFIGVKSNIVPFLFSETCKVEPTEFELFFQTEGVEYRYILHVRNEDIVYESLSRKKFNAKRHTSAVLFTRDQHNHIELFKELKTLNISKDLSSTLPLLSYLGLTHRKNIVVKDVLDWLEQGIDVLNYGTVVQELMSAIVTDKLFKKLVLGLLQEMDIEISDFRIEQQDDDVEIYTQHLIDGVKIELPLEAESSGTQKVFDLLPRILQSLILGNVLIIDELDAKLHPLLLKYIINLFRNKDSNPKGAQLIFTSHDLSTMNKETFRRDEIWFVAKGVQQNSKLYSLVEFKMPNGEIVRSDAKYDKQYLEGNYGADPYLRKMIDWEAING